INQKDAIEYCEKLNGRLPEEYELVTLLDRSKYSPAILSPEIFSDTKTDAWYWTITPCAWGSDGAWIANFNDGHVHYYIIKDSNNYVRPVRDS
ncbi:MAG: DUF1566 domain-containing protein, partial [Planctomycetia bacterium]|nr:DUF1566 domain-containing protein [Planctomycetia bacterium]